MRRHFGQKAEQVSLCAGSPLACPEAAQIQESKTDDMDLLLDCC